MKAEVLRRSFDALLLSGASNQVVVYDQSSIAARGKPIVVWGVNQYEIVAESTALYLVC